jgi:hypothetical protein
MPRQMRWLSVAAAMWARRSLASRRPIRPLQTRCTSIAASRITRIAPSARSALLLDQACWIRLAAAILRLLSATWALNSRCSAA